MKPKTGKYSDEQLMYAIQAVNDGSTQFAAARKYGIPRSTLFNKISGKSAMGKKPGPGPVLSAKEERVFEKWVVSLAERGFPVIKRQLLRSVQLYLNTNKRSTPFLNNFPGRKWYKSFLIRHPITAKRLSQNLTQSRAAVTENKIRRWHSDVHKYCEDHDLLEALNDPSRVFNMDEKGFILSPKDDVVLARRGQKAVYNRSKKDEKECVTALLGGNAAGVPTPPMIVYASVLLQLPSKWSGGISDNGWQTQVTFYDYITNVFYKWLLEKEIKLPVILFIDGHESHISLPLSEFFSAHQIEPVALYPNATHIIQPMDVAVFKTLNTSWEAEAEDWKLDNNNAKIDKMDVASILNDSIKATDYKSLLITGFRQCGLFPFNVENISFKSLLPTLTASVVSQDQLWNDAEDVGADTEQKPSDNEKQGAQSRLKHLEELIDGSVLNMFRLLNEAWAGQTEYAALYEVWKKMYLEASEIIVADGNGEMILDIDIDSQVKIEILNEGREQLSILGDDNTSISVVEENGLSLKFEDSNSVNVKLNEIVSTEPGEVDIDVQSFEGVGPDKMVDSTGSSPNDVESMEVHLPDNSIEEQRPHSPLDLTTESLPYKSPHDNKVNADAFKQTFYWPKPDICKIKENLPREKISTVLTSEEWKENEREKMEEKLRKKTEKKARKAAREKRKIEKAEMKTVKKIQKEKKKNTTAKRKSKKRRKEKREWKNSAAEE